MTTYYEKKGRRYHPVREEQLADSFPVGAHLVVVLKSAGATLHVHRYNIHPNRAGILAAVDELREAMADAMSKRNTSTLDPHREYTKKQVAAFHTFAEMTKDEPVTVLRGVSPMEVVEAGVDVLEASLEKDPPAYVKNVREIVVKYLRDNSFDGLFSCEGDCSCTLKDGLVPCGEIGEGCRPGYAFATKTADGWPGEVGIDKERRRLFGAG